MSQIYNFYFVFVIVLRFKFIIFYFSYAPTYNQYTCHAYDFS